MSRCDHESTEKISNCDITRSFACIRLRKECARTQRTVVSAGAIPHSTSRTGKPDPGDSRYGSSDRCGATGEPFCGLCDPRACASRRSCGKGRPACVVG